MLGNSINKKIIFLIIVIVINIFIANTIFGNYKPFIKKELKSEIGFDNSTLSSKNVIVNGLAAVPNTLVCITNLMITNGNYIVKEGLVVYLDKNAEFTINGAADLGKQAMWEMQTTWQYMSTTPIRQIGKDAVHSFASPEGVELMVTAATMVLTYQAYSAVRARVGA